MTNLEYILKNATSEQVASLISGDFVYVDHKCAYCAQSQLNFCRGNCAENIKRWLEKERA